MRIAVVGAGAIGTWLGAGLARAGHDVALLARGAHLRALREHGVRVEPADGEPYDVHPHATDDAAEIGVSDVVLLTVKAHDQAAAGAAYARHLVGPDTTIVAAQNGIPWWLAGDADTGWPAAQTLGCVMYVGASVPRPGVVATRPERGFVLGEPDGSDSDRLRGVAGALGDAGFPVTTRPDIRVEVWTKLMGNATSNPLSMLTRSGLKTMMDDPETLAMVRAGMEEVVAVASALGTPPDVTVDERLATAARLDDFKTSTLQDVEAGRRVELDALLGSVLHLAARENVPVPTLRRIFALADLQARSLQLR